MRKRFDLWPVLFILILMILCLLWFNVNAGELAIEGLKMDTELVANGYAGYYSVSMVTSVSQNGSVSEDGVSYAVKGPFDDGDDEPEFSDADFSGENSALITENGWYFFAAKKGGEMTVAASEINTIDRISPVISSIRCDSTGDGEYGRSALVTVYAYDTQSRLAAEAFSFDDGESYEENCFFETERNGVYHIRVRDALGNVTRRAVEVKVIDDAPPVMDIKADRSESSPDPVTLTVSCSDEKSGIRSVWRSDGSGGKINLMSPEGSSESAARVIIDENGIYTFFASDMAGNVASCEVSVSLIDKSRKKSSSKKTSSS